MQKVQKTYTAEFKREAVRLAQTSGKPIAQVARELGISDTSIHQWRKELTEQVAYPSLRVDIEKRERKGARDLPPTRPSPTRRSGESPGCRRRLQLREDCRNSPLAETCVVTHGLSVPTGRWCAPPRAPSPPTHSSGWSAQTPAQRWQLPVAEWLASAPQRPGVVLVPRTRSELDRQQQLARSKTFFLHDPSRHTCC
jgi:transposase